MKTQILPKEVVFDEKGYIDLITKIESLEKNSEKLNDENENVLSAVKNILTNLEKVFNISPKTSILLVEKGVEIFVDFSSIDKPTLIAK